MAYGAGSVTILGFDPTTSWIAEGEAWDAPLWRRLLPARSGGTVSLTDDSTIVGAVSNLPSLALPPIGGLIVLLIGYIILVGPVNYLVLRWLDRREWAWVTVPALILVFAVGAFGFGSLLRGSDVIVHEVAIVRGAPGTDQAVAQSYLGVFSPSRASFQVRVPGNALLAAPMNGDIFGSGAASNLDVLQGDPSRIRDLAVGYGSLRTIRAEAQAAGPRITTDLRSRTTGSWHVTNASTARWWDRPSCSAPRRRTCRTWPGPDGGGQPRAHRNPLNQASLSDRVVGRSTGLQRQRVERGRAAQARPRSILDQLT